MSIRAVSFEKSTYGSEEKLNNHFIFIQNKRILSFIYCFLHKTIQISKIYKKNSFQRKWIKNEFNSFPTKPGHFSRTLSKGPNTTTWIWNLHADAHDFDSHTSDLEEISRKVFSAHFGQLGVIFIWLSGCETNY